MLILKLYKLLYKIYNYLLTSIFIILFIFIKIVYIYEFLFSLLYYLYEYQIISNKLICKRIVFYFIYQNYEDNADC